MYGLRGNIGRDETGVGGTWSLAVGFRIERGVAGFFL